MKIKGMDGTHYDVTGQGQGALNTVLGAIGTYGALNSGALNGLLGGIGNGGNGWRNGGCSPQDVPVTRYEAHMMQELGNKDSKIALLESNIYTDQKIADVYERLNGKINANKDAQEALNLQQAVYNGTNTAAIGCIQGQIQQLFTLTKLSVPASVICPPVTTTTTTTPTT